MRSRWCVPFACVVVFLSVGLHAGCQQQKFSSTVLNPFNFKLPFLPYQEPVRIGIVHRRVGLFDPSTWKIGEVGSPWTPLRLRLERHLGAPVQISDLKPFQVAAHLQSSRIDFAFLSAGQYLGLVEEFGDLGNVIAVSDVLERQGLIVAVSGSDIRSIKDIEGERFSFGPAGDPVLDVKTREILRANGISDDDIKKELLPIPNSFQHHLSSAESAFEIVYGIGTHVGVIDKSEYEDYPDTGGSFFLRTFSKNNFLVLAETQEVRFETISEGPFVAGADVDPKLVQQVREFLLDAATEHQPAMRAMGLAAFVSPVNDVNTQLAQLASHEGSAGARKSPPPANVRPLRPEN
ncbi:MAG: phosphate/phosphite/phosphonate ABC transporter substrate-binding protein [Planctomycetes bacterium]|nr:phosphate/phosphite/phosphonate ABC transporter substrate-binding protein [Planctomycetota bacterium]